MNGRRAAIAVSILCAFALLRVALTHRVFSPTFDEPIHVAAGYEWLTQKTYTLDREHPPLARIFFALPFRNAKIGGEDWVERGSQLYASAGDYLRGVARSRRGNLLFLLIAIVATTLWTYDLFGPTAAVLACGIFSMLPPVLAHAGLATTDISGVAGYAVAMFALYRWLAHTTWLMTIAFGITVGFALVTKFSFPVFFAVSLAIVLIARRRIPIVKGAVAAVIALLFVWATYRFDHQRLIRADPGTARMATDLGAKWMLNINWPAPSYVIGLMQVALHDRRGHPAYFMGVVSETGGFKLYFPVVFAIKTPIPLLVLAVAGGWLLARRRLHRELILLPIAILAIAMTSHINLGVRHILPIYVTLSMLAAFAVEQLRAKWFVATMCAWLVGSSLLAHPDYLPWASALGGRHPERIVVDSNFDWGQDLARLRTECRRQHIDNLGTFIFGTADYQRIGLPPTHGVDPYTHEKGWIAVSESAIIPNQARDPLMYVWLTSAYEFKRVGKTIRLYHVTD